ncbi:MAG: SRPBCC domain-containing protein [Candidatus Eremiobacteraeota bacterium]|nr:SRPBCC domain-containing protein [Candidatus Eremiobacteraeota bacterium]
MNDSLTAATPILSVTRVLDAPRSLVWKAWTDPAHVSRWWGPHGCTVSLDQADRRPGGHFRREMLTTGGALVVVTGTFEEVIPEERLVSVGILERPGSPPLKTRMTVTFEDRGGKTELTIVQTKADFNADSIANANIGWAEAFEKLEAHLASEQRRAG